MYGNNKGNLLVVQSGGPTHVINHSLAGLVQQTLSLNTFDRIYGAAHGVVGLLSNNIIDLSSQPKSIWPKIARTPSAALGTTRRKLTKQEIVTVVAYLTELNVSCLVSIGGNDSAQNAHNLEQHAISNGSQLNVIGIPKTIDNDLPETDHCPGYGSAAKFLATATMSAARDAESMGRERPVTIIESMGRNSGWLPLASALGKFEERDAPHIICSPEHPINEDVFISKIDEVITKWGFAVAVVAETVTILKGPSVPQETPEYVDEFGNPYYASPAQYLAHRTAKKLQVRVRFEKPGTITRSLATATSIVDANEADRVGRVAALHASNGITGVMVTLIRESNDPYQCTTGTAALRNIAGQERKAPENFSRNDSSGLPTQAFIDYAKPLLGGPLPKFTRLRL